MGNGRFRSRRSADRGRRTGLTLLELVTSLTAAAVLLAGLAAAVRVSSEALQLAPVTADTDPLPGEALAVWQEDVGEATAVEAVADDSVALRVADRDGDASDETVRYAFDSGTLSRQENDGPAVPLFDGLASLSIEVDARDPIDPPPFDHAANRVMLRSVVTARTDGRENKLYLPVPAGASPGDVLVAVAIVDDADDSPHLPQWSPLLTRRRGDVGLAVWWKFASAQDVEDYRVNLPGNRHACGWVMCLTGCDPADPIGGFASREGYHWLFPVTAPTVGLSGPGQFIVRIIAAERDSLMSDALGPANAMVAATTEAPASDPDVSGGCAVQTQPWAGTTDNAAFYLTRVANYIAATLVLRPAEDVP